MRRPVFYYILISLLAIPAVCFSWAGKVVSVSDGDTIKVLHDGKEEKIRLYGVDCPEKDQAYGQKAKEFTASLVAGKDVDVQRKDTDRYGRTVGLVTVNGRSLNESLVRKVMPGCIVNTARRVSVLPGQEKRTLPDR